MGFELSDFLVLDARLYYHNPFCIKKTVLHLHYVKSVEQVLLTAEREGFEPPVPLSTSVFKTDAIDHSAISPQKEYALRGSNPGPSD